MKHRQLDQVAEWAGVVVPDDAVPKLEALEAWLASEASEAGGIGPHEASRVWERHVLDGVMFAKGIPRAAAGVIDVGTGVGLPGLPLAIVLPEVEFVLLDRSGRRIRLIRRALRVLGTANARAVEAEERRWFRRTGPAEAVVMRGVHRPNDLVEFVDRSLAPGGVLVSGAGLDPEPVDGAELVRFPGSTILEPGRWLRIMRHA